MAHAILRISTVIQSVTSPRRRVRGPGLQGLVGRMTSRGATFGVVYRWLSVRATAVLAAGHVALAAEPWRVAEQPDLKLALEKAPVLQTESLGEPARGTNPWEHDLVPNPDGKSWDVLQWYMEYGPGGRQQLYIIDL